MPYFQPDTTETLKLPSNPDYWVKVKTSLTFGDTKTFISVSKDGSVTNVAALEAFMKSAIVEWNLDDGDGKVAPIDDAHINLLSQKDATAIIQAVGATIAGEDKADGDFLDESAASSTPAQ